MKKLFLSYTSLLRLVAENVVTAEDLATGLFFFGCRREHALNPGAAGEYDERKSFNGRFEHVHPTIVQALLSAEAAGRAAWHNVAHRVDSSWDILDKLLTNNGVPAIKREFDYYSSHYSYPGVKDAVAEKNAPVEVVY